MKRCRVLLWLGLAATAPWAGGAEDWADQLDAALSFASPDGLQRGRLSGTIELEGFAFAQPAPALIDSPGETLFNPRLTLFFDGQLGPHVYVFAQGRADRGFDPSSDPLEARLDECAVRITPWRDGRFSLQVGKFSTVVGNWIPRHLAWDNPLINAPLVYEQLTGVWDAQPAYTLGTLLAWAHLRPSPEVAALGDDKYLRLPVIWGPSYATGAAISGEIGRWSYAAEVKSVSLSSRPGYWDRTGFRYPTVNGRLGFRPDLRWNLGFSASTGRYLAPEAARLIPAGRHFGDYRQTILGQDVSFAWHHLQLWAEVYEANFAIPSVGNARVISYFLEGRYKLTPQLFVAARWNEQLYGRISNPTGGSVRWGADVWRIDLATGYRFTTQTEVKAQVSFQPREPASATTTVLGAVQLIVKF